mmetsp:Transcript_14313/g.34815  ORF Transcript_14313/g.34815 Transcript_14313/m.34815 type:complete len:225 (+) Transcript_14313:11270-11944(+)
MWWLVSCRLNQPFPTFLNDFRIADLMALTQPSLMEFIAPAVACFCDCSKSSNRCDLEKYTLKRFCFISLLHSPTIFTVAPIASLLVSDVWNENSLNCSGKSYSGMSTVPTSGTGLTPGTLYAAGDGISIASAEPSISSLNTAPEAAPTAAAADPAPTLGNTSMSSNTILFIVRAYSMLISLMSWLVSMSLSLSFLLLSAKPSMRLICSTVSGGMSSVGMLSTNK